MLLRAGKILLTILLVLTGLFFYLDFHLHFRPIPKNFEKAMDQFVEAAKFPGVTILVFKNSDVVFEKHYGFANIEQQRVPTGDTLYQIASISKLMTATAVMKLYDQGVIDLDEDINNYLPFKARNPHFPDTAITFRMLLTHAASTNDFLFETGDLFTIGKSEDPTTSLEDHIKARFIANAGNQDGAKYFKDTKPGSALRYSNLGFALLGYLVEQVTQEPFEQYCQREIFEPLGMINTVWFNRDANHELLAMPYSYNPFTDVYQPIGYYGYPGYPSGQLKTSAMEFMRFLYPFMHNGETLDGQPFLQKQTVDEFLRIQHPHLSSAMALAWFFSKSTSTDTTMSFLVTATGAAASITLILNVRTS